MNPSYNILIGFIFLLLYVNNSSCQHNNHVIKFKTLDASRGLKSNIVNDITLDQKGILLLGTDNGLEKYDGNVVTKVNDTLFNSLIYRLFKDASNTVWYGTSKGMISIDKQGLIKKWKIDTTTSNEQISYIAQNKNGLFCIVNGKIFIFKNKNWHHLKNFPNDALQKNVAGIIHDENHLFVLKQDTFIKYNFKSEIKYYRVSNLSAMATNSLGEIFVGTNNGKVYKFFEHSGKSQFIKSLPSKFIGESINPHIMSMIMIDDYSIGIGTEDDGYASLDLTTNTISTFYQDEITDNGIANNQAQKVFKDESGRIYISCLFGGVSFYMPKRYIPTFIKAFTDKDGNIFSTYINCMVKSFDEKTLYIGTTDRLIIYDVLTGKSKFEYFSFPISKDRNYLMGIRGIALDHTGHLWLGTYRGGLVRYNPKTRERSMHYKEWSQNDKRYLPSSYVHFVTILSDKNVWAGSFDGLICLDPLTAMPIIFDSSSPFSKLPKARINTITEDYNGKIWIGYNSNGIYCIDKNTHKVDSFNIKNGFPNNNCQFISHDKKGNTFISHANGITIFNKNNIKHLNENNGLKFRLTENIFIDKQGLIWLTNNTVLTKYDIAKNTLTHYDEKYGIPNYSFIANSIESIGDFHYIGTEKGLLIVNSKLIQKMESDFSVIISKIRYSNQEEEMYGEQNIKLKDTRGITFIFNTVNLNGAENMFYKYKLAGYDNDWQSSANSSEVKYNGLPYGAYTFSVKASTDGKIWKNASFPIHVEVLKPFYLTIWFMLILALLLISAIYYFINKKYYEVKSSQEIKIRFAELEVKAIRAQMNPHFVFNALNSIQYFNYSGEVDKANEYLSDFAKLMRLVLQQSKDGVISLDDEIDLLSLYLKIEALRFDNDFNYSVRKDSSIDETENYILPSMVVQPFAENAIKHGLVPKIGQKQLKIIFSIKDNNLLCIIEDNGIGIKASKALLEKQTMKVPHQSMGMELVKKRLEIFNSRDDRKPNIDIEEKQLENDNGTKVIISLPI